MESDQPAPGAVTVASVMHLPAGAAAEPEAADRIAVEAPLELRLDGRAVTVLMRTPGHDEELIRGFLYNEGLIARAEDVLELGRPPGLSGDELGNVLAARLAAGPAPVLERLFYSSSSCGVCGKTSIRSLAVRSPRVAGNFTVASSLVCGLPAKLRAAQPAFAQTGGLHAAGLFDQAGQLIAVREDVGRHNALDKLIGWALPAGELPLGQRILVVSGRVSYEIVQKAIAAGVPLIAAVGAPSSLAIDLAEQFDVTLAGFVEASGCNVYSGRERISAG